MNFPSRMPEPFSLTEQMIEALGVKPLEAYLGRDLMFVLENEEDVQKASPDFSKLEKLPDGMGVLITAKGKKYDFVSRCFFLRLKLTKTLYVVQHIVILFLIGQNALEKMKW